MDVAKEKTAVIVTADHGVFATSKYYFIRDIPEVTRNLLLPPVGDNRATFFFSKLGRNSDLSNAIQRNIEGFKIIPSREMIVEGAFGQNAHSQSLEEVVGDFTLLSKSRNGLQYPYFEEDRVRMPLSSHGGMTAEEVLVPLMSFRASRI